MNTQKPKANILEIEKAYIIEDINKILKEKELLYNALYYRSMDETNVIFSFLEENNIKSDIKKEIENKIASLEYIKKICLGKKNKLLISKIQKKLYLKKEFLNVGFIDISEIYGVFSKKIEKLDNEMEIQESFVFALNEEVISNKYRSENKLRYFNNEMKLIELKNKKPITFSSRNEIGLDWKYYKNKELDIYSLVQLMIENDIGTEYLRYHIVGNEVRYFVKYSELKKILSDLKKIYEKKDSKKKIKRCL